MGESIKRIVGPYQDSYSPNGIIGEKDACGVGFIANIKGVESNWILKQSLKGLNCMEHRGGCGGDSDSGDGAGILCSIPWNYLEKEVNLTLATFLKAELGFMGVDVYTLVHTPLLSGHDFNAGDFVFLVRRFLSEPINCEMVGIYYYLDKFK